LQQNANVAAKLVEIIDEFCANGATTLLNYVLRKAPPFPGGKGVRYSGGDNGQKSADKPI
jgi:hypothetical protein